MSFVMLKWRAMSNMIVVETKEMIYDIFLLLKNVSSLLYLDCSNTNTVVGLNGLSTCIPIATDSALFFIAIEKK